MKYLLPLFVLASLTVSCTRYQYLSINSSSKAIQKNSENQFVEENDSLLVIYEFKGRNMPLNIMISNKSDQPVLIDWQRSSVVINDQTIPLLPEEELHAPGSSDMDAGLMNGGDNTHSGADTRSPSTVEQIPPRSHIKRVLLNLAPEYFNQIPRSSYERRSVKQKNGQKAFVKEATFIEAMSPLRFSTYLTVLPQGRGEENSEPVRLEHSFYVSGVWRSGQFWNLGGRPYIEKTTTFTNIVVTVAAVTVVGAIIAVAVAKGVSEANQEELKENY